MNPLTSEPARSRAVEAPRPTSEIDFPDGLIGLPSRRYTLLEDGSGHLSWLRSMEGPALSIPVSDPFRLFKDYTLDLSAAEAARLAIPDLSQALTYVTVRQDPDSGGLVVNLRAPIIIFGEQGFQVINQAPDASLRAPVGG